jgi:hypothetical protein
MRQCTKLLTVRLPGELATARAHTDMVRSAFYALVKEGELSLGHIAFS